jgi:hypothetical protein
MFCPGCGTEDPHQSQFCRACGSDLRDVRACLEVRSADGFGATAREQIGRALAAQVRELKTSKEMKRFAEEVLPQVEAFLEQPQEKRLRRVRGGVVTAAIGLGATLGFLILAIAAGEAGLLFPSAVGMVALLIGLAVIVNGLWFTVPGEADASQRLLGFQEFLKIKPEPAKDSGSPAVEKFLNAPPSVVEHTTRDLVDAPEQQPARQATGE